MSTSEWWMDPNYQEFLERILKNAPESWDDDAAAEHIAVEYVHEIERRLVALGGSLERFVERPTPPGWQPPDLDAIVRDWLQVCGPCDYGVHFTACTCPPYSGEFRHVISALVAEVERLRIRIQEGANR